VAPNAFSDLMIYDEENVLLNSTESWDGTQPKNRASDALNEQRRRFDHRQNSSELPAEVDPVTDMPPVADENSAGWSMVGTSAALALTQEILRQALEIALRAPDEKPQSRKLTAAQKDALFARIGTYVESHGGRLMEIFRRFDKDHSGAVDINELERMLGHLGMEFTAIERRGLMKLFDVNGDMRVSYAEFLEVCHHHNPASRALGSGMHSPRSNSQGASASKAMPSSTPRSTSQYQEYLAKMSSSNGMAARRKATSPTSTSQMSRKHTKPAKKTVARPQTSRPAPTPAPVEEPEMEPRLAFSLEFTAVTDQRVNQMAKKSKRHCVQVKKELVILPANRRPRRAALLAASQKAEKYRQSWETLCKLIETQGESMVQETLAAMRATIITEDNLVPVVQELINRFPLPDYMGEDMGDDMGANAPANSMGPLYASAGSPMVGGKGDDDYEDDSTDSEDDMGDLKLLGLA